MSCDDFCLLDHVEKLNSVSYDSCTQSSSNPVMDKIQKFVRYSTRSVAVTSTDSESRLPGFKHQRCPLHTELLNLPALQEHDLCIWLVTVATQRVAVNMK